MIGRNWRSQTWLPYIFHCCNSGRERQKIPGASALRALQAGQNQIAVVVIAVKKKAVVPKNPRLPRKQPDVLRLDGQNLAGIVVIEGLYLGAFLSQALPHILMGETALLLLFQTFQSRIVADRLPRRLSGRRRMMMCRRRALGRLRGRA